MTHVLFTSTLWMDSGLPEDYAVNTWHLTTPDGSELAGAVAFQSALTTFFTSIDNYLSAELEGTVAFKAYDMSDPTPRVPILIDGAALTPSTSRLPSEVALCMSFQSSRVSGTSQARRRGRVYIGPLGSPAIDTATGRPAGAFRTDLANAGSAMIAASDASTAYQWVVYSTVDDATHNVVTGWVDNAFDTQRRRGVAPTIRTTFS